MGISIKARHLPPRIATGAFLVNSGGLGLMLDGLTS